VWNRAVVIRTVNETRRTKRIHMILQLIFKLLASAIVICGVAIAVVLWLTVWPGLFKNYEAPNLRKDLKTIWF
jgi:hypothetical protein